MRHLDMDTNIAVLHQSMELFNAGVVGCDIAGDEKLHTNLEYKEFFDEAGVRRFAEYGGVGRSQNRNVGKGVHICRALPITDSKPFLAGFFEVGIVAFVFCTQGIGPFEAQTLSVNGAL